MSLLIDLETYTSDEHIPLGHIYVCLRGILCIRRKSEFYTERWFFFFPLRSSIKKKMLSFRIETVPFSDLLPHSKKSVVRLTFSERRQGHQRKEKEGLIALQRPKHALKSKDFRLSVHGTKGRCELCTRVGESLYSAPFFCGSYFLLLTRVLYLEPPSFRMPASKKKSVYWKHRLISRQSLKKSHTTRALRQHHIPKGQESVWALFL